MIVLTTKIWIIKKEIKVLKENQKISDIADEVVVLSTPEHLKVKVWPSDYEPAKVVLTIGKGQNKKQVNL